MTAYSQIFSGLSSQTIPQFDNVFTGEVAGRVINEFQIQAEEHG